MLIHNLTRNNNCQKKSYNKTYFSDKQCHKFSDMQSFDAARYAEWFNEHFKASPYKSLREVSREVSKKVKTSPETISRLARSGEQDLTGSPSRPKLPLVDRLSELFNRPIDEGRLAAGYAPVNSPVVKRPATLAEFVALLETYGIFDLQMFGGEEVFKDFTEDDYEDFIERMKDNILHDIKMISRAKSQ